MAMMQNNPLPSPYTQYTTVLCDCSGVHTFDSGVGTMGAPGAGVLLCHFALRTHGTGTGYCACTVRVAIFEFGCS